MNHTQLIQGYIDLTGAKSYLEIGLGDCRNFDAIRCESKIGVDPSHGWHSSACGGNWLFGLTSDAFFEMLKTASHIMDEHIPHSFGIAFIDGLHEYTQVLRDIENAMRYLSPNGLILLHDTNPPDEKTATPLDKLEKYPPDGIAWCGDVWKAVCVLNSHRVYGHTHREDYGLTVIRKQELPDLKVYDITAGYSYKEFNRERILNLLPINTPVVMP